MNAGKALGDGLWENSPCPPLMEKNAGLGQPHRIRCRPKNAHDSSSLEMMSVEQALASLESPDAHPSRENFMCILHKCRKLKNLAYAKSVHMHIRDSGLEALKAIGNHLVPLYVECGSVLDAQDVFDRLAHPNEHSWTSLIQGYIECGDFQHALDLFRMMQAEHVQPSRYTFLALLKACAVLMCLESLQRTHMYIIKDGFEQDALVGGTLMGLYTKFGILADARDIFDSLPVQDVVSWNTLIAGYAEQELGEEALKCLEEMQLEGISPNDITYFCSLKACSSIGAVDRGREIYAEIAKQGYEAHHFVGNSLVDLYAKCGSLAEAHKVFDKLAVPDTVSWNALIAGYARGEDNELVFSLLRRMREKGIKPNATTFLSLLSMCTHAGLVDKGKFYFQAMSNDYGINPTIKHYNCMVDLLGRAGQFHDAMELLKEMPFQPNFVTWITLLSACQKWCRVELGRHAFECATRLDRRHPTAFILMSNIYADAHMWEDVKKIESMWDDVKV